MAQFLESVRLLPGAVDGRPLGRWSVERWVQSCFPHALASAKPYELGPALEVVVQDETMGRALLEKGAPVSPAALHQLLLSRGRSVGRPMPLQKALDWFETLLGQGGDPDAQYDHLGVGPMTLLERAQSGVMPEKECVAWTERLLALGANPNLQGHPMHGPPLELAIRHKTPDSMLALLRAGANWPGLGDDRMQHAAISVQLAFRVFRMEEDISCAAHKASFRRRI